ncbi:putative Membrane protein insertase YidC [Candidatus Zixiibacteriota bacterium]|nr:putative Membrane protein insertase YidC [candidate division Zixibacteria bacterium]
MDKKTILIVLLLVVLVIFWVPIMTTLGLYKPAPPQSKTQSADTLKVPAAETKPEAVQDSIKTTVTATDSAKAKIQPMEETANLPEDTITVETENWVILLSNHGGGPISLKLKKYDYPDDGPVEMLPDCKRATPQFFFAGGTFDAGKLAYQSSLAAGKYVVDNSPLELTYIYNKEGGGSIAKRYRFYPQKYEYDLVIEINNHNEFNFEREYSLEWNNPLEPTELEIADDYSMFWAATYMGGERTKLDDYTNNQFNVSLSGTTNWVANRSKYFTTILIPQSREASGVKATGKKEKEVTSQGATVQKRVITTGLVMDMPATPSLTDSFSVFVGPIDYDLLKGYKHNIVDLIDIGTTPFVGWIIKIFAVPIMWLLPRMYQIIPNYGAVIIVFSLLVKLVTWPLSRKSVRSMMAMKEIQPKLEELKKKHKNNPQALNREMMKLYKDAGVNPFSGCLIYLPQLPLFFALFAVFRSTILLRQAPFILWWNDLSRGALSFTDPYIIMVVIMMVVMFIQQHMTMTDPKNKALVYIMPPMMGFFFYKAAAGLVLYWTCFSLFSLIEQIIFKPYKKQTTVMSPQS